MALVCGAAGSSEQFACFSLDFSFDAVSEIKVSSMRRLSRFMVRVVSFLSLITSIRADTLVAAAVAASHQRP